MAEAAKTCPAPVDKTKIALPRILSLWDVVMIVIGGVIGSGIFLPRPKIAAAVDSPLLMLAVWVVGGMFSFFGAVAFAELGAAMPEAGGIYVYLREAYGPLISFLFGWTLFLVIDSGSIATLAVAFSPQHPAALRRDDEAREEHRRRRHLSPSSGPSTISAANGAPGSRT